MKAEPIAAADTLYWLRVKYNTERWQPENFGTVTWYLNNATANTHIISTCVPTHEILLPFVDVYPNPTDAKVIVESDKNVGVIRVYDGVGRLILNQAASDLHTVLDLSPFSNGLYIVKIGTESFKIIKK
jgi:Secretion system C-terminal sorting domain